MSDHRLIPRTARRLSGLCSLVFAACGRSWPPRGVGMLGNISHEEFHELFSILGFDCRSRNVFGYSGERIDITPHLSSLHQHGPRGWNTPLRIVTFYFLPGTVFCEAVIGTRVHKQAERRAFSVIPSDKDPTGAPSYRIHHCCGHHPAVVLAAEMVSDFPLVSRLSAHPAASNVLTSLALPGAAWCIGK